MNSSSYRKPLLCSAATIVLALATGARAQVMDIKDAMIAGVRTHPEINQAIQDKQAIEFEREQAQGQFRPRVTFQASAGVQKLTNPTRRELGIANNVLYPWEGSIVGQQILIDSGVRANELKRQASRTDAAAMRVEERSQFVALNVAHEYLNYLLQQRVVAIAEDNITFHEKMVRDLGEGVQKGSISIADQQQAQERLEAARVQKTEAEQDMANAATNFQSLTGLPLTGGTMPDVPAASLPPTLEDALAAGRDNAPKVREAKADIDTAYAEERGAEAEIGPSISLEGQARHGRDVDGFKGNTTDLQARVVLKVDLYNGGINRAKVQEMGRRLSEARFKLSQYQREAEQEVRDAWTRVTTETALTDTLARQSKVSDDLVISYRQQFNVGRRSLLDVLDSQSTRNQVQVKVETSRFAKIFAQYQLLAATNTLLSSMGIDPSVDAKPYARRRFDVPATPEADSLRRRNPS
jgi:adhesin transport system outer membrane protein